MDVSAVLGWLALALALNTSVTLILAVLTIRSGLDTWRPDPGRRPRSESVVGSGPVSTAEGSDPLAGAIEAFLGRSDGLFRAGGPAPGRPSPPSRPSPPAGVSAHDRPLSEVTWATSRPSRFVPSGPPGPAPTAGATATVPGGRSVTRVSIALAARDGSDARADAEAVARLGPVIGGFLRERTRGNDSVSALTGARYSIILPDTSLEDAAALMERLTQSCDAWLAAEEPPLRLEFGLVDLPAHAAAGGSAPIRASGPERRRAVSPEA
jgi:hypothetical protein